MYERFFQLERTPFSMVPDPSCVHLTDQHADVLGGLVYGILDRKGYLLLTGEAGLGKTTLVRSLGGVLTESNVQSSVIFNPTLTASEFLEMALLNFGMQNIDPSKTQRLRMLEDFLKRCDANGTVCALIVDEAHKLSPELLEEVRLLGNFELDDRKLLQIVLVGQNELLDRLNHPDLWQLKQRIAIRLNLKRLEPRGVKDYLEFRWTKAGGQPPIPFTPRALEGIGIWSQGIPRLVNAIADNSLLLAFSLISQTVEIQHVQEACADLDLPTPAIPNSLIPVRPNGAATPAASASGKAFSRNPNGQAAAPAVPPRRNPADQHGKTHPAEIPHGNPQNGQNAPAEDARRAMPLVIQAERPATAIREEAANGSNGKTAAPTLWIDSRPSLLKRLLDFAK